MRVVIFLLGVLFLRLLPFGFVARWSLRLGILGGLAYAAIRTLKPEALPGSLRRQASVAPSGWTAQETDSGEPTYASTPTAAESGFAEVVVEDLPIDTEPVVNFVDSAPPEETETATDTQADAVSDPEPADSEPAIFRRWIKGDGTLDCPDGFPVKAKASSLIYHTHESNHYHVTIPDVCFASAEEAEAAGYRAPLR